jgi:cobyrinic acid a,c-diamide synthase
VVGASVDTAALLALARPSPLEAAADAPLPRLGARIAVARDRAFVFAYDAVLQAWRDEGAILSFFSPLADESPEPEADAIYLPGGYPELFAGQIAGSAKFLSGLRLAARRGAVIYGECGGYMVLGQALSDEAGKDHAMAGLLPVRTSFASKRLHLGYRQVSLHADGVLGKAGASFRGHEFHYATIAAEGDGAPLFRSADADGRELELAGRVAGKVMGSFVHLIDRA